MRGMVLRTAVVILAAAALPVRAQAKDLAEGLVGRWSADKQALFEMTAPPFYKLATPEKKKEMLAQAMKDVPDMGFLFTADTVTASLGGEAQAATYKVTRVEKRTVYFDALAQKAPEKGADHMYAEFVDDDTIKLSKVGDEMVLVLKREK
jgi:hypothetical protein